MSNFVEIKEIRIAVNSIDSYRSHTRKIATSGEGITPQTGILLILHGHELFIPLDEIEVLDVLQELDTDTEPAELL